MFRSIRSLISVGLAVLALAGCGGNDNNDPPSLPPLSQTDADDLMQQAAMMMASDRGGWLSDVNAIVGSLPRPVVGPGGAARLRALMAMPASAGRGFQVFYDSTYSVGAVLCTLTITYTDTLGDSLDVWESSAEELEAIVRASGPIVDGTNFVGAYRHLGEPITGIGIEAWQDTVNLSGLGDDAITSTFTPAFRTGLARYVAEAFTDYDLFVIRSGTTAGNPTDGYASMYLFADRLRSDNPADIEASIDGEVSLIFDGTGNPIAEVTNDPPNAQFRYRVNLRTGAIQRIQ
jgi:hypothetical protein